MHKEQINNLYVASGTQLFVIKLMEGYWSSEEYADFNRQSSYYSLNTKFTYLEMSRWTVAHLKQVQSTVNCIM